MTRLRPYQARAITDVHRDFTAGIRADLLVAPTGAGKGSVAVRIATDVVAKPKANGEPRRVVFSAPRKVIVEDFYRRLVRAGMPRELMGMLMGSDARENPGAPAQVGCLPTLLKRAMDPMDLLVFDEAHMDIDRQKALAALYPRARILGMTATPERGDGRGLGELYQRVVMVARPSELIAQGYMVEPRVWTVPPEDLPDVSAVPLAGSDYDQIELAKVVTQRRLVGCAVRHWQERAEGRRTVAFCVDRRHAQMVLEEFLAAGVPAEYLDANTPDREREAIFGRLERGETLVLASIGTLTTGWDAVWVKCVILLRPMKGKALFIQGCGRALRPWRGVGAVILDHAGNCRELRMLPHWDVDYSLEGRPPKGGDEVPPPKTCKSCWAIFPPSLRACPRCGAEVEGTGAGRGGPKTVDGELVEITRADFSVERDGAPPKKQRSPAQYLNDLVFVAVDEGLGEQWVLDTFRKRHGDLVPENFTKAIKRLGSARTPDPRPRWQRKARA